MSFYGIALSESDIFSCPVGEIEIDKEGSKILHGFNEEYIMYGEKHHLAEHAIEVQLPYLLTALDKKVKILPIIIGENNTRFTIMLSRAIKNLFEKTDKKYCIIITADLSHELKQENAVAMDNKFIDILKTMDPDYLAEQLALNQIQSHGGGGIITLLRLAKAFKYDDLQILKYFTSGDVTNEILKVEGYLSAVLNYS